MSLKTRITLLVLLAMAGLSGVFSAILWANDKEMNIRYHNAVVQTKKLAWHRLKVETRIYLKKYLEKAVSSLASKTNQTTENPYPVLSSTLQTIASNDSNLRADIYNSEGELKYTTVPAGIPPEILLRKQHIVKIKSDSYNEVDGLIQGSKGTYMLASSRAFSFSNEQGVLLIAKDITPYLRSLTHSPQDQICLLDIHGKITAVANPNNKLPASHFGLSLRKSSSKEFYLYDKKWLVTLIPIAGPDTRQIASLLWMEDITQQQFLDNTTRWGLVIIALCLIAGLSSLIFMYLRNALEPLERAVQSLDTLRRGNLDIDLDSEAEEDSGEAGRIVAGVSCLRQEMLNLQMLKDERNRSRQQQERLIRGALKKLAKSLNEKNSRADILEALRPSGKRSPGEDSMSRNELAELASILGRMSELVTSQQNRLVKLLTQLHVAMQKQSLLVSLQQELEIARNMQKSILPRTTPKTKLAEVSAIMIPATEVGGDFYDYFLIDEHRLALVIADVSGKGVPAAFFMAIARTLLKSNAKDFKKPSEIIERLNLQLCADNDQMMFVTVFFAILDLSTGNLTYVNAGHNPPIIYRKSRVNFLCGNKNMALAVSEIQKYQETTTVLLPGDTLLLYTDGVTEATNLEGSFFGEKRLLDCITEASSASQTDLPNQVLNTVRKFESGTKQADDITCLAVRYRGKPYHSDVDPTAGSQI